VLAVIDAFKIAKEKDPILREIWFAGYTHIIEDVCEY
jgi:hypothetical protein